MIYWNSLPTVMTGICLTEQQYLYDLETDPYEKNNLVGNKEYREISKQLAEILKRKMVEAGEKEPVIISGQI